MSPSISIVIVGGGLGGLATALSLAQKGHRVKVLESASQLTTIGGGIGIPPNSMRVMHHFGIAKRLHDAAEVDAPERLCFRRYTGELLCDGGSREKLYKYDHVDIHRAAFQKLLVEAASEAGAEILVNTRIIDLDESGPSPVVIARDGRRFEADLIIGADGAKSTLRNIVYPDIQLSSSNNIYRAVIDGSILQKNPRLASLLDEGNIWWGPGRCIVGIPIQRKAFYALSCTHPGDTGTAGEWNKRGDLNQMKATYSDFEPRIRELIEHVNPETLLVWKLTQLPELDSWVFGSGRVVLIGDAAHAVLPYSGQGHAMAMEDSVTLAECLARVEDTAGIPKALRSFETIRKPRLKLMAEFAELSAHRWQMPDGEEQRKRDAMLKTSPLFSSPDWDGNHVDNAPESPTDPLLFPYIMAHDAVEFANQRLDEIWNNEDD